MKNTNDHKMIFIEMYKHLFMFCLIQSSIMLSNKHFQLSINSCIYYWNLLSFIQKCMNLSFKLDYNP